MAKCGFQKHRYHYKTVLLAVHQVLLNTVLLTRYFIVFVSLTSFATGLGGIRELQNFLPRVQIQWLAHPLARK